MPVFVLLRVTVRLSLVELWLLTVTHIKVQRAESAQGLHTYIHYDLTLSIESAM